MVKELKIGTIKLNSPFILAPLAGITDAPFRKICHRYGAALTYSEMVSAKGLYYGDKNTENLLQILPEEGMVGYQIFGHEPEIIGFAAKKLDDRKNVLLDINMGCPVPKIVKNFEGSYLMKNPDLVFQVVEAAVRNSSKPVTVKIRSGWDDNSINAPEVAKAIEAGGASAVAVHGRTREQFYSGKADWSVIADVKKGVKIPVIANGDVVDGESGKALMEATGCDFVMIGRGALGNPWIFQELNRMWLKEPPMEKPTAEDKKQMMLTHLEGVMEIKGEYVAVREMRKHVGWYLKGIHGAAKLRGEINKLNSYEELKKAILEL